MPILIMLLFLASIVGANVAVSELAPVPVGFGQLAPAGVYFVALTLALRDLVQRLSGALGVFIAGGLGLTLSLVLAAPEVAWASAAAFLVSFVIDTVVFSLVARRMASLAVAVLVSGVISLVPDTLVFCYLAGFPEFIPGQLLGKTYGTLAYAALLAMMPARRDQRSSAVRSE